MSIDNYPSLSTKERQLQLSMRSLAELHSDDGLKTDYAFDADWFRQIADQEGVILEFVSPETQIRYGFELVSGTFTGYSVKCVVVSRFDIRMSPKNQRQFVIVRGENEKIQIHPRR